MKQISIASLVMAAVIAAAVIWVTALGFYGYFPAIKTYSGMILWIAAVICAVLGFLMRRKLAAGEVGLDRTQVNPMTVAFNAVFGQTVAWIGAIFGGGYLGLLAYIQINASHLLAAQNDVQGVIIGTVGGVVAAVAGVWLERGCIAPPSDGEAERSLEQAA